MKLRNLSLVALLLMMLVQSSVFSATVLFEDFEDATVGYTINQTETSDGAGDFYGRIGPAGLSVGPFYSLLNVQGDNFFAAMDTDGDPPNPDLIQLDWVGLNIAGLSNLQFSGFFAEDDDAGNQDWDDDTSVIFSYQIDGGGYLNLFAIEAAGGTNTEPLIDTDFDGIGDGAAITESFTQYFASIIGTGTTLDLRAELSLLDAGDEDIAFDNITITATAIPEPGSFVALGVIAIGGLVVRRCRAAAKA